MSEEDIQLVKYAADRLMDHFDSVRIFVTKHDGTCDVTTPYTTGAGNFYAQLGQVNEWRATQNEIPREEVRQENQDGDGGLETA